MTRNRPGFLSLLFLIGAPLVVFFTPHLAPSRPDLRAVLTGAWTQAYAATFDENLSLRPAAVATWGALTYGIFGEGRKGVLVGADGWLFSGEEFAWEAGAEEENLAFIWHVRDELQARGVGLVVALVPDKARLYPEHLGPYRRPEELAGRYVRTRQALMDMGIAAPDLWAALRAAAPGGAVFLRTDTHWTPYGADVAARALARALPTGDQAFVTTPLPPAVHTGDLMKFLPLGWAARWMGPDPDVVTSARTRLEGETDLFGDLALPLALVGTSYSANPAWNFAGFLQQASRMDLVNMAREGGGPFAPMRALLGEDRFPNPPPRFIIWEMPERYVSVREVKP